MSQAELLKTILVSTGVVGQNATDAEVQTALAQARYANPTATQQALQQGGYVETPWLTYLGIGAGAVALYFIWQHYSKTKKLGIIDRPEAEPDIGPRIRNMGRTLGHFKGRGSCSARRGMGRRGLGSADYEFEPEIRLEGFRGKRRSKRSKR